MAQPKKIVSAHCNRCLGDTKHLVLFQKRQVYDEVDSTGECLIYQETMDYELLECCGCELIVLRLSDSISADSSPPTVTYYYPPNVSRRTPEWHMHFVFKSELGGLLKEIYSALHAGSNRLAMMGARALIDVVMREKLGDTGTFKQKLDQLETNGYISENSKDYLNAALEAGHAAAHRGYRPATEDVNRVMDIVENLLQAVYVLQHAANHLNKATPPRPPKHKTP